MTRKRNGWGGARPGAGRPPMNDATAVRETASTRLTATECTEITTWGAGGGLGLTEALRSAALLAVESDRSARSAAETAPAKTEKRLTVTTRLTADERAQIEAWGERNGLGFSEALREAALLTVNGKGDPYGS
jgi:hypothetical protein